MEPEHTAVGLNCRSDEQRKGADYDQDWSQEDDRLLDIDLDLRDLDCMPSIFRKWNGNDVGRIAYELERMRELKAKYGEHPTWAAREAEVMRALGELRERKDPEYPVPWNKTRCPFAWATDRNNHYLTREFRDWGRWLVGTWRDGDNCRFEK